MDTGRTCVYCGRREALTGEHVVPDCFQKSFEAISIAKTSTGDKAILSAQQIHDVCACCNNGPLSRLDSYLCFLNDRYFLKTVHAGHRVRFEYDFDLLQRMLLKIGYNVARTRHWPLGTWQQATATRYILEGTVRPSGLRIFLQILVPTPVTKTRLPVSPGTNEIGPLPWHAELKDVSSVPGLDFLYSMSFWSYRFFVLWGDMQAGRDIRRQATARWLRNKDRNGAYELTSRGVVTVYASSVTALDALKDDPAFLDQLAKARKLKSEIDSKQSRSKRSK
jgi:hypothetical protein